MQNERGKESNIDPVPVVLDVADLSDNGLAAAESTPAEDTDTLPVPDRPPLRRPATPSLPEPDLPVQSLPVQSLPVQSGPRLSSGPIRNDVTGFQNYSPPLHRPVMEAYLPPHLGASSPNALPPNGPLTHVPWQVSDSWGATTLNITANTAAGVSYLFWWVSGFLVYFSERNNRFVRFHALQSIILTGVLTVAGVFALLFAAIMHDLTVATHQVIFYHFGIGGGVLLGLSIIFVWLWTMIAAWTGNYLRLPLIGSYAERYSAPPAQPIRHPLL